MVKDPKEPIGRIERGTREGRFEHRVADVQVAQQTTIRGQGDAALREGPSASSRATDQFTPTGALERFLQAIARRVEQGVGIYHALRLPGHGRVIHDRRAGAESEEDPQRSMVQGSLQDVARQRRPHYFRDRTHMQLGGESTTADAAVAEKPLTAFETTLVARFEEGKVLTTTTPQGSLHFLKKTAAQWMSFFKGLLHRTIKKEAQLHTLGPTMTFRGLVKDKAAKGVMIGDLAFQNGLVEKFARFEVELTRILPQMQGVEPGASLGREVIAQGIQTQSLQYFAIGAPAPETAVLAGPRETAGIFTTLKTETLAAERLGLRGDDRVGRAGRAVGEYEGGGAGLGSAATDDDHPAERFVPWWRWDREKRSGLRRWIVPVALSAIVVVLLVALAVLVRNL